MRPAAAATLPNAARPVPLRCAPVPPPLALAPAARAPAVVSLVPIRIIPYLHWLIIVNKFIYVGFISDGMKPT
jgi:hypothetical protein